MTRLVYVGNDQLGSCLTYLLRREDVDIVLMATDGRHNAHSQMIFEIGDRIDIEVISGVPNADWVDRVNSARADLLLCAAFSYRVPVIELLTPLAINIHPSLLPLGRGPTPWAHWVIEPEQAGVTLHRMNADFDTGDIILQERAPRRVVYDGLNGELASQAIAPRLVQQFLDGPDGLVATGRRQTAGSYAGWPALAERSFSAKDASVGDVKRLARRFGRLPCVCYLANGSSEHVLLARALKCKPSHPPGRLVRWSAAEVVVSLTDGLAWFLRAHATRGVGERVDET